jgi:single-strand DNA-binding protein
VPKQLLSAKRDSQTGDVGNSAGIARRSGTMTDIITVRGIVGTEIKAGTTKGGTACADFRLASKERRFDRETQEWVDGQTNWYTVQCYRKLAENIGSSLRKGQHIIVTGKLRLRQWTSDDGRQGTACEIDADSLGHDLFWGTANFVRSIASRQEAPSQRLSAGPLPGEEQMSKDDVNADTGEIYDWGTDASTDVPPEFNDDRSIMSDERDESGLRMAG